MRKNKFKYDGEDLFLEFQKYADGMGTAITIVDENEQPYSVLTINMPNVQLESNEFIIKNYSENEGMADTVFATGWFEDTGKKVRAGFALVPIWRFK